jgi:phenylalanyl-tRNA synthetase beta chain
MRFTYNWLKEFVNVKIPAQELAKKLTMAGLEVVSAEPEGNDFVFEAEVTSNRPDCLSIVGIAREVAAITGKKLSRYPVIPLSRLNRQTGKQANRLTINIENKKDCPLYNAKIIRDVKVAPSPGWLKARLELVGCRSINNVVDITNYIMFTWGQPLHAFDLDKLNSDRVSVRRARAGEKLVIIDGQEKALDADILVIANKNNPVAIAGVMGGRDTEVSQDTKNILLEAAVFNPTLVRSGRRKLGLESESSYRFERGVDLEKTEFASSECVRLIQELAQGKCVFAKSSAPAKTKAKNINLNVINVKSVLGIENINQAKIKKILDNLEFKLKLKGKNNLVVEIPSHRLDVALEADLIEEIARLLGYENIPTTLPAIIPKANFDTKRELVFKTKNILAGLGLNEVITYSLISWDLLKSQINQLSEPIEIANPLSKEQEILRSTLIPSLLKCTAYNLNQKENYINVFEIAKGFLKSTDNKPREELLLGIALCGTKSYFLQQGLVKEEVGILNLKGILDALFERLGVKGYNFRSQNGNAIDVYIHQEKIGRMLKPAASVLENLDIKNKSAVVLELSLDRLFSYVDLAKRFVRLPIYPAILRDISFILKEEIPTEEVLMSIKDKAGSLLRQVKVADYYKGRQISTGFKGLTISCTYRSDQRTLTETEINPMHADIINLLKEKFQAQIR